MFFFSLFILFGGQGAPGRGWVFMVPPAALFGLACVAEKQMVALGRWAAGPFLPKISSFTFFFLHPFSLFFICKSEIKKYERESKWKSEAAKGTERKMAFYFPSFCSLTASLFFIRLLIFWNQQRRQIPKLSAAAKREPWATEGNARHGSPAAVW